MVTSNIKIVRRRIFNLYIEVESFINLSKNREDILAVGMKL